MSVATPVWAMVLRGPHGGFCDTVILDGGTWQATLEQPALQLDLLGPALLDEPPDGHAMQGQLVRCWLTKIVLARCLHNQNRC